LRKSAVFLQTKQQKLLKDGSNNSFYKND